MTAVMHKQAVMPCIDCQVPVSQNLGRGPRKLRCDECWVRSNHLPVGVGRACLVCGGQPDFNATYCSAHRPVYVPVVRREVVCPVCGAGFRATRLQRFCSPSCRRLSRSRVAHMSPQRLEAERARMASRPPRPHTSNRWKTVRALILADHPPCGICLEPIDYSLKFPDRRSPAVDHIVSWRLGGAWFDLDNLQAAHFACNSGKNTGGAR